VTQSSLALLGGARHVASEPALPIPLSSLVGRASEVAALGKVLARHRLVTVVGAGGVGKSRLALAVAYSFGQTRHARLLWVDLAPVPPDESLLAAVVAKATGISQALGDGAVATLFERLRSEGTMLVLDNCEHVVEQCSLLVEQMLRGCPKLTVLATSREALRAPGEKVYEVEGLPVGNCGDDPTACDAVELFCERASALAPGWCPGAGELATVAALCKSLDGLPLAIELAAAMAPTLGVREVSRRLAQDLNWLRHPERSAPERHRTLQAALDWSYRLLTPKEKELFRALGCFQGTFSLSAAEAVAAAVPHETSSEPGRAGLTGAEVASNLASLAGKSLVQVARANHDQRYRLLGTVRQYAFAKLGTAPERLEVLRRHSEFCLGLAKQPERGLDGQDQRRWLELLELEQDNMRAALGRELAGAGPADSPRPDVGGELAGSLWAYWSCRGYYDEARSWLERALALSSEMSLRVRARVAHAAGLLASLQCEYQLAQSRLQQALSLEEELGDKAAAAHVLLGLGSVQRELANYSEARRLQGQALVAFSELGEAAGVAASEGHLGYVAWLEGSYEEAKERCGRALSFLGSAGSQQEAVDAMVNLGAAALYSGQEAVARVNLERALAGSRSAGYQEGVARALHLLGVVAGRSGYPEAGPLLRESLEAYMKLGDRSHVAGVMESVAAYWPGAPGEEPAMLLAAAFSLRCLTGAPLSPAERPKVELAISRLKASLGEDAFARCWADGLALSLPEAVGQASQAPHAASHRPAEPGMARLTEREVAVLRLIARGMSNKQIGRELFISQGTAGVHVSNILRKLGVTSRVQAAVRAHEQGL
jgi:predicted ATPase/DNA-binding CsgD family transcriptional regulator